MARKLIAIFALVVLGGLLASTDAARGSDLCVGGHDAHGHHHDLGHAHEGEHHVSHEILHEFAHAPLSHHGDQRTEHEHHDGCEGEGDDHCCHDHHHHAESADTALTSRTRDTAPQLDACPLEIPSPSVFSAGVYRLSSWRDDADRVPDHVVHLRTVVLLT